MQCICVQPAVLRCAIPSTLMRGGGGASQPQQLWEGGDGRRMATTTNHVLMFRWQREQGRLFGANMKKEKEKKRALAMLIVANLGQGGEPKEGGDVKGDKNVQDMLVGMVQLQTGKMRVTQFVDERSKHLSDIATQAKEEYDKIAQDAMRNLDEAGSKILISVEEEAQKLEDELASARAEMEADDRDLEEFEENVDKARSEGLFFKGLYSKPMKAWKDSTPEEKEAIKEQADAVANVAKASAVSQSRRFLYGVLIFLLSLTLVEGVSGANIQWPKLALYFLVLVALVAQLTYEKFIASNGDGITKR